MALILLSFLLFIVALIVMPKRIYEAFQKRDFSSFGKKMALVLADMLLFGLSFFAVMAESGEVLFGISLSLVALLVFAACFAGAMLLEAFQKKAPQNQKIFLSTLTAFFLVVAVLLYVFILR